MNLISIKNNTNKNIESVSNNTNENIKSVSNNTNEKIKSLSNNTNENIKSVSNNTNKNIESVSNNTNENINDIKKKINDEKIYSEKLKLIVESTSEDLDNEKKKIQNLDNVISNISEDLKEEKIKIDNLDSLNKQIINDLESEKITIDNLNSLLIENSENHNNEKIKLNNLDLSTESTIQDLENEKIKLSNLNNNMHEMLNQFEVDKNNTQNLSNIIEINNENFETHKINTEDKFNLISSNIDNLDNEIYNSINNYKESVVKFYSSIIYNSVVPTENIYIGDVSYPPSNFVDDNITAQHVKSGTAVLIDLNDIDKLNLYLLTSTNLIYNIDNNPIRYPTPLKEPTNNPTQETNPNIEWYPALDKSYIDTNFDIDDIKINNKSIINRDYTNIVIGFNNGKIYKLNKLFSYLYRWNIPTDIAILKIPLSDLDNNLDINSFKRLKLANNMYNGQKIIKFGFSIYTNFISFATGFIRDTNYTFNDMNPFAFTNNILITSNETNLGHIGGPLINLNGEILGIGSFIINSDNAFRIICQPYTKIKKLLKISESNLTSIKRYKGKLIKFSDDYNNSFVEFRDQTLINRIIFNNFQPNTITGTPDKLYKYPYVVFKDETNYYRVFNIAWYWYINNNFDYVSTSFPERSLIKKISIKKENIVIKETENLTSFGGINNDIFDDIYFTDNIDYKVEITFEYYYLSETTKQDIKTIEFELINDFREIPTIINLNSISQNN